MRFKIASMTCATWLITARLAETVQAEDSSYIFVDLSQTQTRNLPSRMMLKPQTSCPVTNKVINKKLFIDYKGKRIYVCCPACLEQVKKNPKKYINILAELGQGVETILFPDDGKKNGKKSTASKDASPLR